MRLNRLKRIRVGVSLLFFMLTALLFLDFRNWFAPAASSVILYPQFLPSFLKFMHGAVLGATGFVVVLLLTFGTGRVYCSTICPLGTLQDLAAYFSRKRNHLPAHYLPPHTVLRYSILALSVLLLLLGGSNLLLNFLDPFSTFGRIITNILRPVGIVINNGGAIALERFGIYTLAREHWAVMAPHSTGIAAVMLLVVLWLAVAHGRLYCNTICPVGTLLGLVARFSFLRLRVDKESCTNCRRCTAVCKAGCIDLVTQTVDMSRCVVCFNCLSICTEDGIKIDRRGRFTLGSNEKKTDTERRGFLLNSMCYLLALTGLSESSSVGISIRKIIQSKPTTIPVVMTSPVSPPGSLTIAHFTDTCTACHLCVSACPPQILLPSFLEYGLSGIMQPRMNFQTGHCNYECTICADVCPAGAIMPLTMEDKKTTQIGVAQFIKENCVVFTDNTACGACSEHCPTKAVNMVPYENPLNKPLDIPEVNLDFCIGCGGCEHACPTKPHKAIFVDGNSVHKTAKYPVVNKVDQQVDYQKDFPF